MTDACAPGPRARAVILFLGAALAVMLGTALKERLTHPELVVRPAAPPAAMPAEAAAAEEGGVGALMRRVGENPQDMGALVRLIEALVEKRNWAAAEAFAQRAVALDVSDPQPLYLLGIVMHNQGRHREAAETLEKVAAMHDGASVRYSLGVLYLYFLHDVPRGLEHLRAGMEDAEGALELKAAIRQELDKHADAVPPQASEPAAPEPDRGAAAGTARERRGGRSR